MNNKHLLSVVVITKNAQKHINNALGSAIFADEVVVLDSGSTDATLAICNKHNVVVYQGEWLGFGPQKNKAIDLAKHNWVFVLDADEVITDTLQKEIFEVLQAPNYIGYRVPRLNNFFGKYIKSCGLYPDYSIRLFDKTKARFNEVLVHESVQVEHSGTLKNPMMHEAYESIEEFIIKQNKYSSLSAKKPHKYKALVSPMWTFFKLYIIKGGFRDGWHGYIIAKLYAQYTFWKYIKKK